MGMWKECAKVRGQRRSTAREKAENFQPGEIVVRLDARRLGKYERSEEKNWGLPLAFFLALSDPQNCQASVSTPSSFNPLIAPIQPQFPLTNLTYNCSHPIQFSNQKYQIPLN